MPRKNETSIRVVHGTTDCRPSDHAHTDSTPKPLTRFLPSFVGSKADWVGKLERYRGRDFVEFFAGSAAISANLANRAVLNDVDEFLYKYFKQYESQPIVATFTDKGYFARRSQKTWYRYLYYLQKMSFSGVYRWGRNGYNVAIKKDYKPAGAVRLKDEVERSIERFTALNPTLYKLNYWEVPFPEKPDIAVLVTLQPSATVPAPFW